MESVGELTGERSRKLAETYRALVLVFGCQLTLSVANVVANVQLEGEVRDVVSGLLALGIVGSIAAIVYLAYRTAQVMRLSVPWAWGIGMLVPYANVVTLLMLSSKATAMCRAAGIPVGFLGPKVTGRANDRQESGAA